MSTTQRVAADLLQRFRTSPAPAAASRPAAHPNPAGIRLFRVVTIRGDLVLGLSAAELAALGPGPDLERLTRRFDRDGQITGWLYLERPAPDGQGWWRHAGRIAVPAQDALTLQPQAPGLPVQPPPVEAPPVQP